ncbi:MAG: hypothetical protein CM1200mP13_16560 [Candidatus Pelagibacterales bacterium]|nr:MAG: hypothetical protein CM1200mP13_16560 [Pelagibacterales bacterium]
MSYFKTLKEDINKILKNIILKKKNKKKIYDKIQISDPPSGIHADVSTNIAFTACKFLKINPRDFADIVVTELKKLNYIKKIIIEGPGFINIDLKKNIGLKKLKKF